MHSCSKMKFTPRMSSALEGGESWHSFVFRMAPQPGSGVAPCKEQYIIGLLPPGLTYNIELLDAEVGFVARTKALTNLPSIWEAIAPTSRSALPRNS